MKKDINTLAMYTGFLIGRFEDPDKQIDMLLNMVKKYEKLEATLIEVIGYTAEQLIDLCAKGYTLEPPVKED